MLFTILLLWLLMFVALYGLVCVEYECLVVRYCCDIGLLLGSYGCGGVRVKLWILRCTCTVTAIEIRLFETNGAVSIAYVPVE